MPKLTRRNVIRTGVALAIPPSVLTWMAGRNQSYGQESNPPAAGEPMKIQYLEIVTPEVDALCSQYSKIYDITFSEPMAHFGGARTAKLDGGGMMGIRGPMRDTEKPVVRPYVLVDDIKAAVESASKAGAEVAMPPMEIPEHGQFAIVIHGGIDCGFWQN